MMWPPALKKSADAVLQSDTKVSSGVLVRDSLTQKIK